MWGEEGRKRHVGTIGETDVIGGWQGIGEGVELPLWRQAVGRSQKRGIGAHTILQSRHPIGDGIDRRCEIWQGRIQIFQLERLLQFNVIAAADDQSKILHHTLRMRVHCVDIDSSPNDRNHVVGRKRAIDEHIFHIIDHITLGNLIGGGHLGEAGTLRKIIPQKHLT